MHTAYINDHVIRFMDIFSSSELERAKGQLVYTPQQKSMEELISAAELVGRPAEIIYLSENPDVSWQQFISCFGLIEAAGGLVKNNKGEYLLIYRRGKWDLPKGKLDYDETPEQAAIREVREECGIQDLSIENKLPSTFHTYQLNKKRKLKKTHWFLMHAAGDASPVPQAEEDIESAVWMNVQEIREQVFANTYASVMDLLKNELGPGRR